MARKAKPRIDNKSVEARLEMLNGELPVDELDGLDLVFAKDLLREYAGLTEMAVSLRNAIERDGILVEKITGAKDNRRVQMVENSAFGTYYKVTSRMGDLANKTSQFIKKAVSKEVEQEEVDDFDAFNA